MSIPHPLITEIYISPDHNYFGHAGKLPGAHPLQRMEAVNCLPGKGIEGDRFSRYPDNHNKQITFFAREVYDDLVASQGRNDRDPGVFRRNVITRGLNLNDLIGKEFSLQGIVFFGVQECSPCFWMDSAFGPGTKDLMKDRGGLRARILTPGTLRVGGANLRIHSLV